MKRNFILLLLCFVASIGRSEEYYYQFTSNPFGTVNNTNYTNVVDVEINTLSDIIYIRMKNDVSFILDTDMSLYEHQITYNPNMPLRGIMYFSTLYAQFLTEKIKIFTANPL